MSQPVVDVSSSHMSNVRAAAFTPLGSFTRRITPSLPGKGGNSWSGNNLSGGVVMLGIARRMSRLVIVHESFADDRDDNMSNKSMNITDFFMMRYSPFGNGGEEYYRPAMK